MTGPVLMVVDEDAGSLGTLDATLRNRYGHDYLVIGESSPAAAIVRLLELRAAGRPVAVVMAASTMTTAPAAEFLAHAHTIATQPGPGPHEPHPQRAGRDAEHTRRLLHPQPGDAHQLDRRPDAGPGGSRAARRSTIVESGRL